MTISKLNVTEPCFIVRLGV